jgi:hypothetical protein
MEDKKKMLYESIYAAEDEVDTWREKIYAETEGMTMSEFNEYIRRKAEPVMREFHLQYAQH